MSIKDWDTPFGPSEVICKENAESFTSLEEAAEECRRKSCNAALKPSIDGLMPEYGGSVKAAFIAGAEWQAKRFEENRLAACKNMTQGEYERETEFVDNFIKEHHRLPTISDAIELTREQMMEEAVEGEVVKDINNKLAITAKGINLDGFKFGQKVKIIIVKDDNKESTDTV